MIKSMTGFGVGASGRGRDKINVEIKSLNSRFLEIKLKGIGPEPRFEEEIRKVLEKSIVRGNLLVKFEFDSDANVDKLIFDEERYESIQNILKSIYIKYGNRLNISDIITSNDLIRVNEKVELNYKSCMVALQEAIENLNQMRKLEGKNIKVDILDRLKKLYIILDKIDGTSNKYSSDKRLQLQNKVRELIEKKDLDESRLIQEVAYYSEKSDITEEVVRCKSHFKQLELFLEEQKQTGKKISFLLQEIVREVNTIGSKSPQIDVTMQVVDMKAELEKIREQAQNIL